MLYAKRMLHLPTTRIQQFAALSLTATLAFSLGVATDRFGRAETTATTIDQTRPAAVVAPETNSAAAARVPYGAGWELYDNGWAGGPASKAVEPRSATLDRVPYDAGWELYDGGWAGGPSTGR